MKFKKFLELSNLTICIQSNVQIGFPTRFQEFEVLPRNYNILINLYLDDNNDISFDNYSKLYEETRMVILQNEQHRIRVNFDKEKKKLYWYEITQKSNVFEKEIHFLDTYTSKDFIHFNILPFLELSELLIQYNSVILHSSFINYNNHGIVFSAPSETGKSTQADLWKKYKSADIINGDRTIINMINENNYVGYGSLYAGTSGIYKNKKVRITAIVVLRKALKNRVYKLDKKVAYLCLLSEISTSQYNKNVIFMQSEWINNIVKNVPIYMLECLPDEEAVNILYNELGELLNE